MGKRKGKIKKYLLIALAVIVIAGVFDLVITKIQAGRIPHRFASAEEGAEIMLANTDYYNNYTQNDIDFRMQKSGATLNELLEASRNSVSKFNIFEKLYIDSCFAKMHRTIKKNGYKLPEIDEIVLIRADMSIESNNSGYTHGTEIYLSDDIVSAYTFLHVITGDYFETLLWHEMFHCLTRCNADFRAQMYSRIHFKVAPYDYEFPPCVKDKYLSNPDVEHHNAYATFIIDGKEVDCFPVWTTTMDYAQAQTTFSRCNEVVLVPIDGTDIYYTVDQTSNYFEVFGENTGYTNDPEECMADNFKYAMLYGIEGENGQGYPNPEIIQSIIDYLKDPEAASYDLGVNWDYAIKSLERAQENGLDYEGWIDICNPPEDLLSRFSTQELANLTLRYPLFPYMPSGATDSEADIFIGIYEGYSTIFSELRKREDRNICILKEFAKNKPDIDAWNDCEIESESVWAEHFVEQYLFVFSKELTREEQDFYLKTVEEKTKPYYSKINEEFVAPGLLFDEEGNVYRKTTEVKVVDREWHNDADISWIDPEKPMVALSFDDGPVNPVSDTSSAIRIQNALADNGMHATFFYWGNSLNERTKKELERAYELGFELGNHTKSHPDLTKLSDEKIEAEAAYIDEVLASITGKNQFLLRPPYLSVNQTVKDTINVPLIGCGIDSKDWDNATTQQIIDAITSAAEDGSLDGKIVLMHETYATTAEAVEYLVPYLKENGYQIVNISEMFKVRGKEMKAGTVYTGCKK